MFFLMPFNARSFLAGVVICLGAISSFAFAEEQSEQQENMLIEKNDALRSHSSSFTFAFSGAYFGKHPHIHFTLITPHDGILTRHKKPDSVTGTLVSSIKIPRLDRGRYTLILKNKGNRNLFIIGGFVGVNSSHPIKSHAIKAELAPGEDVRVFFNRKNGFPKIIPGKEHLLEWNPFDWL